MCSGQVHHQELLKFWNIHRSFITVAFFKNFKSIDNKNVIFCKIK